MLYLVAGGVRVEESDFYNHLDLILGVDQDFFRSAGLTELPEPRPVILLVSIPNRFPS